MKLPKEFTSLRRQHGQGKGQGKDQKIFVMLLQSSDVIYMFICNYKNLSVGVPTKNYYFYSLSSLILEFEICTLYHTS